MIGHLTTQTLAMVCGNGSAMCIGLLFGTWTVLMSKNN